MKQFLDHKWTPAPVVRVAYLLAMALVMLFSLVAS
jgi:hypothetical protein